MIHDSDESFIESAFNRLQMSYQNVNNPFNGR